MDLNELRELIREFVDHADNKRVEKELSQDTGAPGSKVSKVVFSRADQITFKLNVLSTNGNAVKSLVKKIDVRLGTMGWFVADVHKAGGKWDDAKNKMGAPTMVSITVQPLTGEKANVPVTMYHVTTPDRAQQIRKTGLVPNTSQEKVRYRPRIYLVTTKNAVGEVANDLAKRFMEAGSLSIVKVKTPEGIEFYKDPEFGSKDDFVYTTDPVPAANILDVIDVDLSGIHSWTLVSKLAMQAI